MAYEGPPDACAIPFTTTQDFLLTFDVDMDTGYLPPADRWSATSDTSTLTFKHAWWVDLHDLQVSFDFDPHPPLPQFDIFYGPIHKDLRTHFSTAYPEFEVTAVPICL